MAPLVSVEAFLEYLGAPDDERVAASKVLEDVEALFLSACGRTYRPFQPADPARTERYDGNGRCELRLEYAIDTLTSVTLGYDVDNPVETLDVDDQTLLRWIAGTNRLTRLDGGHFGCAGLPWYVTVVYATQSDLPATAALAIKEVAKACYLGGGTEGVTIERIGAYSVEYGPIIKSSSNWQMAVSALMELTV